MPDQPTATHFDLLVVGGGPGGYVAAIRASQLGMQTGLIERDKLGGRCLNYACIPAKAVLRSAEVFDEVRNAAAFGVVASTDGTAPMVDFPAVAKRRDRVVRTLTGGVAGLMKKHAITVIEGTAKLEPGTGTAAIAVTVTGSEGVQTLTCSHLILATGSVALPLPGTEFGARIMDTAATWGLNQQPASLAVVGGGASGVEVASAFGRLGTKVTLFESLPQILSTEDYEIAATVVKELVKQNVEVLVNAQITAITPGNGGVTVQAADAERQFDYLCVAAGRAPDTEALGLEQAGVALDGRGLVATDGFQRTSRPGIFAIGDLTAGPALAHKASEEAIIAVESAAPQLTPPDPIMHADIPRATFCAPQVASVGLTEQQAQAAGREVKVGRFPMAGAGAATIYGDRVGMVKLIGDAQTGELIGAHIVGTRAADMIAEIAAAKTGQIGFPEVARMVHAHPTFSEAVMEAARDADGWVTHA